MEYRMLGRTGMRVSEVGLGCEHLQGKPAETVREVVAAALDTGVNILDIFMSEPQVRSDIGAALEGKRDKVLLQGHIGSVWKDGQYGRSRDEADCKCFFEDFLRRLRTDYVDIGMIHYVDDAADWERVVNGPVYAYAKKLKEAGVIRAIGLSSHNPLVAKEAVPYIDVLMFSVNPAFDFMEGRADLMALLDASAYAAEKKGPHPSRTALYEACQTAGVGITVMKTFAAGNLLSAARSPFGIALTPYQCMAYALDRPAVASVLTGAAKPEEAVYNAGYCASTSRERDYTAVLSASKGLRTQGQCMYCNHCLPCPANIDIAAVGRLLDLAGDTPAASLRDHYAQLDAKASDCLGCGSCEANCPFGVAVRDRMQKAAAIFEG